MQLGRKVSKVFSAAFAEAALVRGEGGVQLGSGKEGPVKNVLEVRHEVSRREKALTV